MIRRNEFDQPIGAALPADWAPPPFPPHATLTGQRIRAEPLNPVKHADALHHANMLDKTGQGWTYLPYGPFETLVAYRNWLTEACMGRDPMFYAFVDLKTGKAIGLGALMRIDPQMGVIEVGNIRLSPALQQTPMATEAMYLLMKHVFDLGYRRYEWKCDALNGPSRSAAERLGFVYEGTFRQAIHYRGRNRDTAWFSVLDRDWPALQSALAAWLADSNFDAAGQQVQRLSWFMGR